MEQIKLSEKAEREFLLSQLTDKSMMLISNKDIAFLINRDEDYVRKELTKRADFPKQFTLSETESGRQKLLFVAGDVIRWIKRNAPRFH